MLYTELFEMIVGVLTTFHLVPQMQHHVISFNGVRSRIRFMFLLFSQVSRTEGTNQNRHWNQHLWHATNSLERTRLSCWCLYNHKGFTYRAPLSYVTNTWSVVLLHQKTYILLSQVYCLWQVVKSPTIISNYPVFQYGVYPFISGKMSCSTL